MGQQFIYQISGLTKKFGQKEVLKNIQLAFYPGAKIGVLGKNGSGKSTLAADHGRPGQRIRRGGRVSFPASRPATCRKNRS